MSTLLRTEGGAPGVTNRNNPFTYSTMMIMHIRIVRPRQEFYLFMLLIASITYGQAQDTAAVSVEEAKAAQDAADSWITLIDELSYAESWQQAAPFFQEQISETAWVQQLQSVRGSLGPLVSRAPEDRTPATALPNAPEGEYVVVTYASAYTQLEDAVETVTMMNDDGTWRAVGYYVRPRE